MNEQWIRYCYSSIQSLLQTKFIMRFSASQAQHDKRVMYLIHAHGDIVGVSFFSKKKLLDVIINWIKKKRVQIRRSAISRIFYMQLTGFLWHAAIQYTIYIHVFIVVSRIIAFILQSVAHLPAYINFKMLTQIFKNKHHT